MNSRIEPVSLILLAAFLLFAAPLTAQQFGQAVAIDGDQVLVLKTGTGRGPAMAYSYSAGESGWTESGRLGADATSLTGHGLSPAISVGGGQVFVGSGDPGGAIYALSYRRDEAGEWVAQSPIGPQTGAAIDEAQEQLDLPSLMKILRPAQHILAADGHLLVVATVRPGEGSVEVLRFNSETSEWVVESTHVPESGDTGNGFGSAVAVADGRVFVGAPRQDDGIVYVFTEEHGGWAEQARINGEELGDLRRFGSALAVEDGVLYVGAPGTGNDIGQVVVARSSASGAWTESRRVVAPGGAETNRFGAAVAAAGGQLWIGAPGAREGAGSVYSFGWTASDGLTALETFPSVSTEANAGLGSSLAASPGLVVAGAPSANGRVGQAVVYSMDSDRMWSATVLDPPGELSSLTDGEVRCADGDAAGFSCSQVDLLSFLTIDALGGQVGESVSDLWGWTDPSSGREYALVGRTAGLVIVDITDPAGPVQMGIVPANRSGARDIKVYADHVFFTGDGAQDHGLVVFDLTRLRSTTDTPASFEPDAVYEGIKSAHNLAIDTESGFAFAVGASGGGETCGGGLHMIDIRSPKEPTFAGCYTDTEGLIWAGRTHDTQCVVYRGLDEDYIGRQICFASNETALRIVDVTDKNNPVPISTASYTSQAYIHQGWLTDAPQFFYLDDELDELIGTTERTQTLIWDLTYLVVPTDA